jgi:very-short-patch-repair endonuclease
MSLENKTKLVEIANIVCRELRKNSTKAERILWQELRNKCFSGKKFYRQYPILFDITGKETFFVADFFCYEGKLIVELDGRYHQYRLKEDSERTKILNHLGLTAVRFSNNEIVNNLVGILQKLKEYLDTEISENK